MLISIISVGEKMPQWLNTGFAEYQKRLSQEIKVNLIEVPAIRRTKSVNTDTILGQECERINQAIPKDNHIIALERTGKMISTMELADKCQNWMNNGQNVSVLIGGPEGLSESCLARVNEKMSFSELTFPHPIVRLLLIEQIYRAYTILNNHPYHK